MSLKPESNCPSKPLGANRPTGMEVKSSAEPGQTAAGRQKMMPTGAKGRSKLPTASSGVHKPIHNFRKRDKEQSCRDLRRSSDGKRIVHHYSAQSRQSNRNGLIRASIADSKSRLLAASDFAREMKMWELDDAAFDKLIAEMRQEHPKAADSTLHSLLKINLQSLGSESKTAQIARRLASNRNTPPGASDSLPATGDMKILSNQKPAEGAGSDSPPAPLRDMRYNFRTHTLEFVPPVSRVKSFSELKREKKQCGNHFEEHKISSQFTEGKFVVDGVYKIENQREDQFTYTTRVRSGSPISEQTFSITEFKTGSFEVKDNSVIPSAPPPLESKYGSPDVIINITDGKDNKDESKDDTPDNKMEVALNVSEIDVKTGPSQDLLKLFGFDYEVRDKRGFYSVVYRHKVISVELEDMSSADTRPHMLNRVDLVTKQSDVMLVTINSSTTFDFPLGFSWLSSADTVTVLRVSREAAANAVYKSHQMMSDEVIDAKLEISVNSHATTILDRNDLLLRDHTFAYCAHVMQWKKYELRKCPFHRPQTGVTSLSMDTVLKRLASPQFPWLPVILLSVTLSLLVYFTADLWLSVLGFTFSGLATSVAILITLVILFAVLVNVSLRCRRRSRAPISRTFMSSWHVGSKGTSALFLRRMNLHLKNGLRELITLANAVTNLSRNSVNSSS